MSVASGCPLQLGRSPTDRLLLDGRPPKGRSNHHHTGLTQQRNLNRYIPPTSSPEEEKSRARLVVGLWKRGRYEVVMNTANRLWHNRFVAMCQQRRSPIWTITNLERLQTIIRTASQPIPCQPWVWWRFCQFVWVQLCARALLLNSGIVVGIHILDSTCGFLILLTRTKLCPAGHLGHIHIVYAKAPSFIVAFGCSRMAPSLTFSARNSRG